MPLVGGYRLDIEFAALEKRPSSTAGRRTFSVGLLSPCSLPGSAPGLKSGAFAEIKGAVRQESVNLFHSGTARSVGCSTGATLDLNLFWARPTA